MSQPVVVHEWSTFALLAAAFMLPMISLTIDEVVAMGQHVRAAVHRGDRGGSTWKVFWLGGTAEGSTADERTEPLAHLPEQPRAVLKSMVWGVTVPWNLALVATSGVWLLAAPAVFGVGIRSGAADIAHLGGAFIIFMAVIAMAEVVRAIRLLNVAAGVVMVLAVVLVGVEVAYAAAIVLTGIAVAALSLRRGGIRETYGGWDRLIR